MILESSGSIFWPMRSTGIRLGELCGGESFASRSSSWVRAVLSLFSRRPGPTLPLREISCRLISILTSLALFSTPQVSVQVYFDMYIASKSSYRRCFCHRSDDDMRMQTARYLGATKKAILALKKYYKFKLSALLPAQWPNPVFPHLTTYIRENVLR